MGVEGQGKQTFTVEDVKWLSLWQVRVSEKILQRKRPWAGRRSGVCTGQSGEQAFLAQGTV